MIINSDKLALINKILALAIFLVLILIAYLTYVIMTTEDQSTIANPAETNSQTEPVVQVPQNQIPDNDVAPTTDTSHQDTEVELMGDQVDVTFKEIESGQLVTVTIIKANYQPFLKDLQTAVSSMTCDELDGDQDDLSPTLDAFGEKYDFLIDADLYTWPDGSAIAEFLFSGLDITSSDNLSDADWDKLTTLFYNFPSREEAFQDIEGMSAILLDRALECVLPTQEDSESDEQSIIET